MTLTLGCEVSIRDQRPCFVVLTPGRLGVSRDTPTCKGQEGNPQLATLPQQRVLGQPGRLFQLQKELIRAEGAGGSGSKGGSAGGGGTETTGVAGVGTALPQPGAGVTLRVGWAPPASHAKTMTAIVHSLQTLRRRSPAAAPAGHQSPYRPIWTTIPPSWGN